MATNLSTPVILVHVTGATGMWDSVTFKLLLQSGGIMSHELCIAILGEYLNLRTSTSTGQQNCAAQREALRTKQKTRNELSITKNCIFWSEPMFRALTTFICAHVFVLALYFLPVHTPMWVYMERSTSEQYSRTETKTETKTFQSTNQNAPQH